MEFEKDNIELQEELKVCRNLWLIALLYCGIVSFIFLVDKLYFELGVGIITCGLLFINALVNQFKLSKYNNI